MKYRNVGKTGLKVSEIAVGAWLTYGGKLDVEASHACLKEAVEQGINFIDIADIYARGKAEEVVGQFLKEHERSDFVISSKVFWPMSDNINDRGLSRKHIMESIDKSLRRLGTDYLDIYYCHRFDWNTSLEETVLAMTDLIEQGKILYWGTSVWEAHLLERVVRVAKELGARPPVVEQPRYNMLDRYIELHVLDTVRYNGMGLTPWSPLHYGILTGKYNDGIPEGSRASWNEGTRRALTEENLEKVRKLTDIANELDITMSQLALAWVLRLPEISAAITGATKPEHVRTNARASDVSLSSDVLNQIEQILQNKPVHHGPYRPIMDL